MGSRAPLCPVVASRRAGEMVCAACERKRRARGDDALVHSRPMSRRDLALEGARALDARRPVNENKALAAMRRTPYGRPGERRATCAVCRCALRDGGTHCNACAYARGVCSGCGVKIMDVSAYNGHDAAATTTTNARDAAASVRDRADVSTEDVERKEAVKTRARVGTKATAMAKEEEEDEDEGEDAAEAEAETRAPPATSTALAGPTSAADAAREMGQAANGGEVSAWRLDTKSGYYYDVAAQVYYDPKTGGYFDCKTQQWTMPEKKTSSEIQKGIKTGSFKDGTRKPDRFGL